MKRHRKPRPNLSKRPPQSKQPEPKARPPKRPTHLLPRPGDRIVRARTDDLVWRLAHAARAISWAPEMPDAGASAYDVLDEAIADLDAHLKAGA
jgi:hypothetical protein